MRKIGERGITVLNELFEKSTGKFDDLITLKFASISAQGKTKPETISDYIDYIVKKYNGIIKLNSGNNPLDMYSHSLLEVKTRDDFESFKQNVLPVFKDSEDYKFFEHAVKRIEADYEHIELVVEADRTRRLGDDFCNNSRICYTCKGIANVINEIQSSVLKSDKCMF